MDTTPRRKPVVPAIVRYISRNLSQATGRSQKRRSRMRVSATIGESSSKMSLEFRAANFPT